MPDNVFIELLTCARLHSRDELNRLLMALENSVDGPPTHWGHEDRADVVYQHNNLLDEITSLTGDALVPTLHRRKSPRYETSFSIRRHDFNFVSVEFASGVPDEKLVDVFSLGNALADALQVEFGIVHPVWQLGERSQPYTESGVFSPSELNEYGPRAICARTWLGPSIARMIGRKRLIDAGCFVTDTAWGGLQIDLLSPPWDATFDLVSAQQTTVMSRLASTEVFGNYCRGSHPTKPGTRWIPLSVPANNDRTAQNPAPPKQVRRQDRRTEDIVLSRLHKAIGDGQFVTTVNLSGLALNGADLTGLAAREFEAPFAQLQGALLTQAELLEANLKGANLKGANMAESNLSLAILDKAMLQEVNLQNAILTNASCCDADLTDADLSGTDLQGTVFLRSRLERTSLKRANAQCAVFAEAILADATLCEGNFTRATFQKCDLSRADLTAGIFCGADFRGANLTGVNWSGANMEGARFDLDTELLSQ